MLISDLRYSNAFRLRAFIITTIFERIIAVARIKYCMVLRMLRCDQFKILSVISNQCTGRSVPDRERTATKCMNFIKVTITIYIS
ncbi:hypothetical protein D3C80_1831350 [compost metagenome]